MRKGIVIILSFVLVGFLVWQTALKPVGKKADTIVIKECVLNEISIGDPVERVIKFFGDTYDQQEQTVQFGAEEPRAYLVYLYSDARIYTENRLVKAVELTTAKYTSPRGPKVGAARAEVEQYYWRPKGASGEETYYDYFFNAHLVFEFDENDRVTVIKLY